MTFISIIIAIVMLSILVIVHEFGHFIVARKNGIFVKEFSIGFGPRIISKTAKSGTMFSWKAIPFGGSCTMLGQYEDEDDDTEDERSFDKKSVWARMSVILAGPVFNFFLAFVFAVIYTGTMGYDPATVTYVAEGSAAEEAGLQEGDLIVKYAGQGISFGRELYLENYINPITEDSSIELTYERDGERYTVTLKPTEIEGYAIGLSYYANDDPAEIAEISEGSALAEAGLEEGDVITSIDGTAIGTGNELSDYFSDHELTGDSLEITYTRRGGEYSATVVPQLVKSYKLGFSYNLADVKTDVWGTLKYSFAEVKYQVVTVIRSLGYLFSGKGSLDMLSGPVGIVEVVSETYSASVSSGFVYTLMNLISLMILLSANLGVLNLLPIPALDGGKFILLVIEAIIRKPVPKKAEGIVTLIGAGLIFLLMIVVLANDILKLF